MFKLTKVTLQHGLPTHFAGICSVISITTAASQRSADCQGPLCSQSLLPGACRTDAVTAPFNVLDRTARYRVRGSKAAARASARHDIRLSKAGLTIKPAKQGDLDGLCGIYSLVNAVAYLYGKSVRRHHLRRTLIAAFAFEWDVAELIDVGMDIHQLDYVIQNGLEQGFYQQRYPLLIRKPFATEKRLRIDAVIDRMALFLANAVPPHSRIVLIGTQRHWTLVHHIDNSCLYLFDSSGQRKAFRHAFSLRAGKVRHVLRRTAIYYLQRSPGDAL